MNCRVIQVIYPGASIISIKENIEPASRAANRRVEIVIRQDITTELQAQLNRLKAKDPERYQDVDLESVQRFNIRPDEVF